MDMKQIMEMAGQLRAQLSEAHNQAKDARFTGEAGGGMVKITLNGRHQAVEVKIDPAAVDPSDLSLLEDLVRAAYNQAAKNLAEGMQQRLGNMAQSFGVDLGQLNLDDNGGDKKP